MEANTIDDMTLGDNIRALREGRGMTGRDLADRLGVTVQAVSQWETGKTKVLKQRHLEGICELFGVRIDDLRSRRPITGSIVNQRGEDMVEKNLSLAAIRVAVSILRPDLAPDDAQALAAVFLSLALVPPDPASGASYEDQLRARFQGALAARSVER